MFNGAAIVMGVTSCGKTTVGEAIAAALGAPFIEGDRLHPKANIDKMSSGVALTDDDRWPWLDQIGAAMKGDKAVIASCSALKKTYRLRLQFAAQRPVTFIFLHGSREKLAERIAARKNHFMPPSLLDSQLAILEPPTVDELAVAFDVSLPVKQIVGGAVDCLTRGFSVKKLPDVQ